MLTRLALWGIVRNRVQSGNARGIGLSFAGCVSYAEAEGSNGAAAVTRLQPVPS